MKDWVDKIVNKLFCCHTWKKIEEITVDENFGGRYHIFHYCCTKCGKFKKIKSR